MQFDHFTIALLILRPDAPNLDAEAAARLQDAHMAHLADLHEAGYLIASGPLSDEKFRGLSILNVELERARELEEQDPAVLAGRFSVQVIPRRALKPASRGPAPRRHASTDALLLAPPFP